MKIVIKTLLLPILTMLLLAIFKDIWRFKKYLQSKSNPNKLLIISYEYYFQKFGSWIGYKSIMDGPIIFPHGPYGIFISNGAVIGKNCVIFQQVTIGSNQFEKDEKTFFSPIIADNCFIGAGAKIIGGIKIGANCRIGANATVYKDLQDNSIAISQPTRIIEKQEIHDNRLYSYQNNQWMVLENNHYVTY